MQDKIKGKIMKKQAVKIRVIQVPLCSWCKNEDRRDLEITEEEYYRMAQMHIQKALQSRSDDFREMLISGTHPECWTAMFGADDDNDDEYNDDEYNEDSEDQ